MEQHYWRKNPEDLAARAEASRLGTYAMRVDRFIKDPELRKNLEKNVLSHAGIKAALKDGGWPVDEKTCDEIGEQFGYGAEQIAAASKIWQAGEDERAGAAVN